MKYLFTLLLLFSTLNFVFGETITVTGVVTHEGTGLPVSSSRVWAWGQPQASVYTDSIGNYSIQILPSTRRIGFMPNCIWFAQYTVFVREGIENDTIINVTLPRTLTVTGLITHEGTDLPVRNSRVWVRPGRSVFADSIGNYSIQVPPLTREIGFVSNLTWFDNYEVFIREGIKNDTIINVTLPRAVTTLEPLIVKAYMGRERTPTTLTPRTRRERRHPVVVYRVVPKLLNIEKQWPLTQYTNLSFWTNVILENINYPEIALSAGIQGTVTARFSIDVSGDLVNLEILRGIGGGTDQEVLRVLNLAPNWSQYRTRWGSFSERAELMRERMGEVEYYGHFILPIRFQIEQVENEPCANAQNEQLIRNIDERIAKIDSSFRACQLCFASVSVRDTFDYEPGHAGAFRFDRTKRDDPNNIRFVWSIIFYYDYTTDPGVRIERGYHETIWYGQNNERVAIKKYYSKRRRQKNDAGSFEHSRVVETLERGNVMLYINNGEVIHYKKTGEIDVVIFVEDGVVSLVRRGEREAKQVIEMQRYSPFVSMSELRPERPERRAVLRTSPAQVSIFGDMGTHRKQSRRYHYAFSFNIIAGGIGGLNGLEVSGISGSIQYNMNGVQISGIVSSVVRGDVNGIQIGGLLSGAGRGNLKGLQISGVFSEANNAHGIQAVGAFGNITNNMKGIQIVGGVAVVRGNISGVQISGIYSNVRRNIRGLQLSGAYNNSLSINGLQVAGAVNFSENTIGVQIAGLGNSSDNMTGLQVSGLGNFTNSVKGLQIAGLANFSERNVAGVQIAGLFNRSTSLRGLQIGLISVNDTIERGGSLSLVNIVRRGFYRGFEVSVADYSNVAFTYRMGARTLYTIYTVGASFIEDNLLNFGIGFGHRRAISNRIDFRPEIVLHNYFPMDFRDIQPTLSTHLRFGFVYNINENLGLSLAPSAFVMGSRQNNADVEHYRVSPIPTLYTHEKNNWFLRMGVGVRLGINF